MNPDYRHKRLQILAKLDQLVGDSDNILAEPIADPEDHRKAEAVIGLLKEMRAKGEEKLEQRAFL